MLRNHFCLLVQSFPKGEVLIDEVATAVRRAAEALNQFHDKPPVETSYGLLRSKQIYYDRRSQKLLVPAIGISNFLWSLGWERFCAWQDEGDNAAAYVSPEEAEGKAATKLTDQYRLGQIAFEMLEGNLPFDVRRPQEVYQKKEVFWNNPQRTVKGKWAEAHQAFARIIFRMLRRDPEKRWESFDELIIRLRTMEDESRALAKRTYEGLDDQGFRLKKNAEFFQSFYQKFFLRAPEAAEKFDNKVDQHKKLMEAMVTVLNFRAGNEPTVLREIVAKHLALKKGITSEEVDKFVETFVDTLKVKLPPKMPEREQDRIIAAWRDLFSPVAEYFKEEVEKAAQRTDTRA